MLKLFKKPIIVLFSFTTANILLSAATPTVPLKRSTEYSSQASRALSSHYSTLDNVSIFGNQATVKDTGQPFTGTYVEFDIIGNAQAVRNYQNGTLNGPMFMYDNGSLSKVSNYSNGIREGEEVEFYRNGNSRIIRYYKNDMLNGKTKSYYSNGIVHLDGNYTYNLRDGQWIWNYENGTKKLIENYKNGTITNITGYSKSGKKEREMKLDNGNGTFTQYYDNGKVRTQGTLRYYKPYGTWTSYSQDGYVTDTQGFY